MSEHQQRLRALAPHLNQLPVDPHARIHYELMSDSLVWSDELPPPSQGEGSAWNSMRGALRFRTTMILGSADERYRADWELLGRLCPHWPGLLPERRQADPSRIRLFEEARTKLLADWEALDDKYEAGRRERATTP
jgi:hypothetical protein